MEKLYRIYRVSVYGKFEQKKKRKKNQKKNYFYTFNFNIKLNIILAKVESLFLGS